MELRLEMPIHRAGSSAVCGGDLPRSRPDRDGQLSISHFLLKFRLEPCMKKGRACPVTKTKLSSSRFPSLYKGNQPQPCTSSCKVLSKASLCCQYEVSAHVQMESFSPQARRARAKPEVSNPTAKGFALQAGFVAGCSLADVCSSYPFPLG